MLELKEVVVPEGLSGRPIEKLLNQNLGLIQSCFENLLQNQGALQEIKIKMTITPAGKVKSLKIITDRDSNTKLEACLLANLKTILFREPKRMNDLEMMVIFRIG